MSGAVHPSSSSRRLISGTAAALAADRARELMGAEGIRRVREVLGTDDAAIERILVAKIERAVASLKTGEPKPMAPVSITPPATPKDES